MDSILETIKVSIAAMLLAVVNDVALFMLLIIMMGAVNFACGLWADLSKGLRYSHSKAFNFFVEYAVSAGVIVFTALGCRLLNPDGDYTYLLRILTSLFAILYAKNVLRNLHKVRPKDEFIAMLNIIVNSKYSEILKSIKDGSFQFKRTRNIGNGEERKD